MVYYVLTGTGTYGTPGSVIERRLRSCGPKNIKIFIPQQKGTSNKRSLIVGVVPIAWQ